MDAKRKRRAERRALHKELSTIRYRKRIDTSDKSKYSRKRKHKHATQ